MANSISYQTDCDSPRKTFGEVSNAILVSGIAHFGVFPTKDNLPKRQNPTIGILPKQQKTVTTAQNPLQKDYQPKPHYKIHQGETPEQLADAVRDILYEKGLGVTDCKFRKFDSNRANICATTGTDRDENSIVWQWGDDDSYPANRTTYANNLSAVLGSELVITKHITGFCTKGHKFSNSDQTPAFALWKHEGLQTICSGSCQSLFLVHPRDCLVAVFSVHGTVPLPNLATLPKANASLNQTVIAKSI